MQKITDRFRYHVTTVSQSESDQPIVSAQQIQPTLYINIWIFTGFFCVSYVAAEQAKEGEKEGCSSASSCEES